MTCQGQEATATDLIPAVHRPEYIGDVSREVEEAIWELPTWKPMLLSPPPHDPAWSETLVFSPATDIHIQHEESWYATFRVWLGVCNPVWSRDATPDQRRTAILRLTLAELEAALPVLRVLVAAL